MGLCHGKPSRGRSLAKTTALFPSRFITACRIPCRSRHTTRNPSPRISRFTRTPPQLGTRAASKLRIFKRPFPLPSPAKHMKAFLAKGYGAMKSNEASIPEGSEYEIGLDKKFGLCKQFNGCYELGEDIGRGHFGYACSAKAKKGSTKGQEVAVKVIPKSKMTTAIAMEDVRREVKILQTLTGHRNLVQFHTAYEDDDNVYIVMEMCKGGELLDTILLRGGKYSEEDARVVLVQILSVVSYCHLPGVVHGDLKPENFLFTTKDRLVRSFC